MTTQEGLFTIPTRIFLTAEHRYKLEALVMREGIDLPDLLTDLLVDHLDTMPDIEIAVAEPPPQNVETELKQRRSELRRLRTRLMTEGPQVPQWLKSYIADLEGEIARLEGSRS